MLETTQAWLNNYQISGVNHLMRTSFEVPDWAIWYHPDSLRTITNFHNSITSEKKVISFQKSLLFDEAQFLRNRIREYDIINVFDIVETSGNSSIPFIYELVQEDQVLGTYVAGTVNSGVNQVAIANLKLYLQELVLPNKESIKFKTDSISRNFNLEQAKDLVLDISEPYRHQNFCNIFLLLHSSLGNSENPKQLLRNVYDSMLEGDYLVVLQGIYRSGTESALVSDYDVWYNRSSKNDLQITREVAKLFDELGQLNVTWNETFNGIQISAINRKPQTIFGTFVPENQEVRLLRSMRFHDSYLKVVFEEIGFRIITASYDRNMNNGMYFLKK